MEKTRADDMVIGLVVTMHIDTLDTIDVLCL